jgi:hypothetical protein
VVSERSEDDDGAEDDGVKKFVEKLDILYILEVSTSLLVS